MKINRKEVNGIIVLMVSGEMYGGPDNMKLLDEVSELADQKKLNLVINLSNVKHVSSNGFGILISTRARYAKSGGILKLCNPNDRVLGILQFLRFNLFFDIYDNEREAIESFNVSS